MECVNTSVADSSETVGGVRDLIDVGLGLGKSAKEEKPLVCLSGAMRNFGDVDAVCAGEVLKELPATDQLFGPDDFLISKPWSAALSKAFPPKESPAGSPEGLRGAGAPVSSTTEMCKFIKDEQEPALIMEPQCADFDLSSGIYNSDAKQHLLLDLNPTVPQVGPDSRGKGAPISSPHLLMCKSEVSRWALQNPPGDGQFWCQAAGVSDEQHRAAYPSLEGLHGTPFIPRPPSAYCAFPGVPPQRLCVICGDEASGCHYGVLTCGSCKVFFKRAVEGHHNYLCAGRNDCIVDKIRRKNCPACRLRKCYQAGMMLGGRKLKRFGALKAIGLSPSMTYQPQLTLTGDTQALGALSCLPNLRELQLSPQIISVLESIEPEMVYSGYDNSQPDLPNLLLNSLNRLCERQLLWIVKWSKSLPGFRSLHINDQMSLIQYSWMNLMVFSLGWRTFQNVSSEYLYFAPDLVLNQERMRRSPIYDLCLAMQIIPQEFANLQVTKEEFLCMKALMLLNTVPLEGLKSQIQFEEMRQNYIRELTKAIHMREKGMVASSQRFYHLTKLMDAMHEIVKKVNLYCLSTYIQADVLKVEFPEMMSEVIATQLPKVLAGMVKPLLFHNK
ncbi:progesterone receptor [Denticeps clupeoides]|uniref:progesterone receptor n=1 Tax=Denticeps clupeoides TaxID=299321 RepID=UPI0010A31057|nr:progesterone receptor [Denticeps clupeoides]